MLALKAVELGVITLDKVDSLKADTEELDALEIDAELTLEGVKAGCALEGNKAPVCGDNVGLKVLTEPAEAEVTESPGANSIDCALAIFIKQRARKSSFFIPPL